MPGNRIEPGRRCADVRHMTGSRIFSKPGDMARTPCRLEPPGGGCAQAAPLTAAPTTKTAINRT